MTIGILSVCGGTEAFMEECRPCLDSVQEYCNHHGYLYFVWDAPNFERPISWARLPLLLTSMEQRPDLEFFAWIDADAMITNPRLPLSLFTDLLNKKHKNVLYCIDGANNLNDGVAIYRNCEWTREFIQRLWNMEEYINHPWWVNAAVGKLYMTEPALRQDVLVINNPNIFNSYTKGRTPWQFGDFIVHFAGMPSETRRTLSQAFRTFTLATRDHMQLPDPERSFFGLYT